MKRKLLFIVGLCTVVFGGGGLYWYTRQKSVTSHGTVIKPFEYARDAQFVHSIFERDRYWLVSNRMTDFNIDYNLRTRAPHKYEEPGTLEIEILFEDNVPAGFIAYYPLSFYEWKILFLWIDEKYRGRGLGKKLILHVIDKLKKQGVLKIVLAARVNNTRARQLYTSIGFVEVSEYDGFIDLVLLFTPGN